MRYLAEIAMRGRPHAIGLSVAFSVIPLFFVQWIATAIVGLVLLRRGVNEGLIVLLWAALPLLLWALILGEPGGLLIMIGTTALAAVLRTTASWELTLLVAVGAALIGSFIFEWTAGELFQQFIVANVSMVELRQQFPDIDERQLLTWLLGLFAVVQCYLMILLLIVARWWQSELYNPGGFAREIRSLRLSPRVSTGLILSIAALFFIGSEEFTRFIPLLTIPLVIGALALIHWYVAEKKLSVSWLVAVYLLLLLLAQIVHPLLASVAMLDSWLNIRNRFNSNHEV
jgi:hypothetical protein